MSGASLPLTQSAFVDCWNRIGVRGDASCPELQRHIHCRNCPVFATSAADRLVIDLSAEHLAQSTARVARKKTVDTPCSRSVTIFRIGVEWLALPTAIIREIVGPRPIHSLPHRRDGGVLGLVNIRGQLLICIGLRQVLQLEDGGRQEQERRTDVRMLVTLQGGASTVYPVDEVYGVQRFSPREVVSAPPAATAHVEALLMWQAKSVSLLDETLLLATVNRSLASATAI